MGTELHPTQTLSLGTHYNENMAVRTSPKVALERLALNLNYHVGEMVSLNRLAEETGLSWATVQKYTKVIETVQKLAPKITIEDTGVRVDRRTSIAASLFSDSSSALMVYLLEQAEIAGEPPQPLDRSEHTKMLEKYGEDLDTIGELGWIELTEDEIRLTPLGVQIAGTIRSDLLNSERTTLEEKALINRVWGETEGFTENVLALEETDEVEENTFEDDDSQTTGIDIGAAAI